MDGKGEGNEDKLSAFARYTAALHQAGILPVSYTHLISSMVDINVGSFTFFIAIWAAFC